MFVKVACTKVACGSIRLTEHFPGPGNDIRKFQPCQLPYMHKLRNVYNRFHDSQPIRSVELLLFDQSEV
jgi:hypothetical protein